MCEVDREIETMVGTETVTNDNILAMGGEEMQGNWAGEIGGG